MVDRNDYSHIPDRALLDRERIRGASRMIAEGTDASAVTAQQIEQVAADTQLFARTHGISLKDVGRSAGGYSPGVVSEFLSGKYKGSKGQVAIDLDAWLVEEEVRRARPQSTQFVWTNVALEIKSVANYAVDRQKVALIYGPDTSGIGKTTALRAILQEFGPRRASLATIDKVDANPTGLLTKLCRALGKNDNGTNRNRQERIVKALTVDDDIRGKGIGAAKSRRSHLLMIDQIHNLRFAKDDRPYYILMDIYDATGAAQLWCGTADLYNYLFKQQRRHADESLAQVRSRVFPTVDLMASLPASVGGGGGASAESAGELLVTVEQVRDMFARNKLKLTTEASRFLMHLANVPDSGSLRLCVQLVEYATEVGDLRKAEVIDVPLLKMAMRRGLIPGRVNELIARVEHQSHARLTAAG